MYDQQHVVLYRTRMVLYFRNSIVWQLNMGGNPKIAQVVLTHNIKFHFESFTTITAHERIVHDQ